MPPAMAQQQVHALLQGVELAHGTKVLQGEVKVPGRVDQAASENLPQDAMGAIGP